MKKTIAIIILILCASVYGETAYRILNSFNAGELTPLLGKREDLLKYQSGCSVMENMIPLPQGGAQKRPGTVYVADSKEDTKIRLLPFQFSTSQSYIVELGNQYARFFTDNDRVLDGVGTEDLSGVDGGNLVAHWLLNEDLGVTVVNDDNAGTLDGTAGADASILHATGKVGTGCFDFDEQWNVNMGDDAALSFTDDTDDEEFSLVCWAYVTQQSSIQNLISKWDETTGAIAMEYRLSLNNERKLQIHLADTSVDLTADMLAQWYLNDTDADKVVDEVNTTYTGALTPSDCDDVTTAGLAAMTPCFDFGGAEAVEVADAASLSFGDGTDDSPFSISAWVYVSDGTFQTILSKHDGTTGSEAREWMFFLDSSERANLRIYDDSVSTYQAVLTDPISVGWHFVVGTYNGVGGTLARNGIEVYVDGELATKARQVSGGVYVAMENTATQVAIGAAYGTGGTLTFFWEDKIDNVILFDAEISAASVSALYNGGDGREVLTSTATEISTISDDVIDIGWHFFVSTYDATDNASATAANGIILYVDGVAVDVTATNDAGYVAMQDSGGAFRIGAQESIGGAAEKFWADKIDEVSLFKDVLTPTEVASLYSTTPYEIETPYLTDDLFELKFEQSADVLYIAHADYETRELSRLANNIWTLTASDISDGPFRTQNDTVTSFIAASATTGSVTLTATGTDNKPFVQGSTLGHEPSGSSATDKSQTGALFSFVHPIGALSFANTLEDDIGASSVENTSWIDCGTLYEGAGWTVVTGGTWYGVFQVQRNYTLGAAFAADGWETVYQFESLATGTARNISTATRTEDFAAADYRMVYADDTAAGTIEAYFTSDQTEVVGIVEITSVVSATSAIGTVVRTLGSTDATYKWSEGSWSNYRGWPETVAFFEDRLIFGGNDSQPDTVWGSVTSDYSNMLAGADDSGAVIFTLTSRQVNDIEWIVGKDKILIGTSGAEWTLAGAADEPLTPTNVKAEQHSTYGSASIQAGIANESTLFFQRGAKRMRELAYNWELDSYVAPDMTLLAKEVTNDGITDLAFQQIPDAILWCIRADGEIAVFSYERRENVTAWSRIITDGDFESVAIISGSVEDQVWVSVERDINSSTVRYVEYFSARDFGSDIDDAFYVDSGYTYDSTATTSITELGHLIAEEVSVFGDGVIQASKTVDGSGDISITSASTVQVGMPYTVQMKTMPLSWIGQGMTIQGRIKRISEVIIAWYNSGDFSVGRDASTLQSYTISGMTTDEDRLPFPPGYDRNGYIFFYQKSPEPLTILAAMTTFEVQ
ncbi:hypothetical protein KAR91_50825 [Candidatus Pacearchaeota archaeon]|nr:hypothetical protein [Candidatus Pacearchaeota archaeon]